MHNSTYNHLSDIYPHLMRFIDYKTWAKYIISISKYLRKDKLRVLELACGNGSLAKHLQKKFSNYIATDLSFQMLQSFQHKCDKKICCELSMMPFKTKFDFIFSTFDSVNYLLNSERFVKMLNEMDKILDDDGIFTFDVSLEKNSLKYQKYLNRSGKVNSLKFKQKSFFNQKNRIHYNQFEITLANGEKVEELHRQKIYHFNEYFKMIDDSKFYVYECLNAFTFDNASSTSERAQFILKKRKKDASI